MIIKQKLLPEYYDYDGHDGILGFFSKFRNIEK